MDIMKEAKIRRETQVRGVTILLFNFNGASACFTALEGGRIISMVLLSITVGIQRV
jgi:hypothetical protein